MGGEERKRKERARETRGRIKDRKKNGKKERRKK